MIEQNNATEEFDTSVLDNDQDIELSEASDANELQAVKVEIEKIADRQRQITAKIHISQPPEVVWKVLTNYEGLPDFIPNLAKSQLQTHPNGGIRLEQVGSQRLLNFNFSARVVLDLEEHYPKEINFQMVEGDFKDFSGSWQLQSCLIDNQAGTQLCYTITVHPKRIMPVGIIERRLSNDLQVNLLAIQKRVETLR